MTADDDSGAFDPDALRKIKSGLHSGAETLRDGLRSAPPALDEADLGRADTAKAVNDAISALFKAGADLAARADHIADQVHPEDGSFGDIPAKPAPGTNPLIRPPKRSVEE